MPRCAPALLLLAVSATTIAAEIDLRLAYGLRAKDADFTQNGVAQTDAWDSTNRIAVGVVVQPSPALGGAFLAGGRAVFDLNEVGNSDYTNAALHIQAGYGFLLTPMFRLEILPYVGLGYASLDTSGGGSGSSNSVEFGFDVNGVVTLPGGFQLGAGIGYALTYAEPDPGGTAVEIEHAGITGSIFLGYRI